MRNLNSREVDIQSLSHQLLTGKLMGLIGIGITNYIGSLRLQAFQVEIRMFFLRLIGAEADQISSALFRNVIFISDILGSPTYFIYIKTAVFFKTAVFLLYFIDVDDQRKIGRREIEGQTGGHQFLAGQG